MAANRRAFRERLRAERDSQPRRVICARCGWTSPFTDGKTGRAAFAAHECVPVECQVIPFPTRRTRKPVPRSAA